MNLTKYLPNAALGLVIAGMLGTFGYGFVKNDSRMFRAMDQRDALVDSAIACATGDSVSNHYQGYSGRELESLYAAAGRNFSDQMFNVNFGWGKLKTEYSQNPSLVLSNKDLDKIVSKCRN